MNFEILGWLKHNDGDIVLNVKTLYNDADGKSGGVGIEDNPMKDPNLRTNSISRQNEN